jgi:hypothetical protein
VSLQVKSTNTLATPPMSVLVYGKGKEGKTTFASTFPKPLIISCEGGLIGLRDKDIDFIEPINWNELLAIIAELIKTQQPGTVEFQGKKYESIVLDSLNELYRVVMNSILSLSKGREMPQVQDWGLASDRVERLIKEVVRLPVHSCSTCLEDMDKDEYTGRILAGPLLPGKLGRKAPALFDYVFHAQTEPKKGGGVNYVLATSTESVYQAGGRYGENVLDQRELPDFKSIYTKLTTKKGV